MIITLITIVVFVLGVIGLIFLYDDFISFLSGIAVCLAGIAMLIEIAIIVDAHCAVNKNIYEYNLERESIVKQVECISSDYEDVSKATVIAKVYDWNKEVYNMKYWVKNPWTSWFYSQKFVDSLEYIELENQDLTEEVKMAILNYTTTVDSLKTVSEIEYILVKHNAKSIMKNYDGESIMGLSFLIDTGVQQIPVRLPVRVDECLEVLKKEKKNSPRSNIKATREQAERVAWRILKDWVEAQMALLDIQMVRFEEIFLPYIETGNGQTIYERLEEKQFLLEAVN